MIFDRISLVQSYIALKIVQLNDGLVKDILFNKTAYYGTKTIIRFNTLEDLAAFINENYPYQYFDTNCQCAVTSKDAIWTPLSFNLTLKNNRYASFVNNLRGDFESAQETKLNSTSVSACRTIFTQNAELVRLKAEYSCFGYMINQQQYVNPCEYVELIVNDEYTYLVGTLYPTSRHPDLLEFQLLEEVTEATIASAPIPELIVIPTLYSVETMFNISSSLPYTYNVNAINVPIITSSLLTGAVQTDSIAITGPIPWTNVDELTYEVAGQGFVTPEHGVTMYFGEHSLTVLLTGGVITVAYTHVVGIDNMVAMITIAPASVTTTTMLLAPVSGPSF